MAVTPIFCDFETEAIEPRPRYPPKPVSLGLHWPGQKPMLMSWGHPAGNNCTEKQARGEYLKARNSKYPMCFQYGTFDQEVAEAKWEIPLLPWERYEDTMFLLALHDPHAPTMSLKPSAERLLGIAPEEQDAMKDWIVANIPKAKKKPSTAGAYISKCPFSIIKPYLAGDLRRTKALFNFLRPKIVAAGMLAAYERERRLMPILLRNAQEGMRVDLARLQADLPAMERGIEISGAWLAKKLKQPSMNVDSDKQLGEALYTSGQVKEFKQTAKGQLSVSKKHLTIDKFKDPKVYHVLTYRTQLSTSTSMFVKPWIELATPAKGLLHANWAQVRSSRGGGTDTQGARSMRIICSKPNLLNIPKKWKKAIAQGYQHPAFLGDVPQLPFMRTYVLPDKGQVWLRRDYNQQEVRLFAEYEEGPVMAGFLTDPLTRNCTACKAVAGLPCRGPRMCKERDYDMHEGVRAKAEELLNAAGLHEGEYPRDTAKTAVFGAFYGQGLKGLIQSLGLDEHNPEHNAVAKLVHKALHTAAPSIKELSNILKTIGDDDLPIRTWGGRLYYKEPSQYSEKFGRWMDFAYKLISYLIQGSAADVTKEALVRYDAHPKKQGRFVVSVYDEIDGSCPKKAVKKEMTLLRDVMRSIETVVPMLSDGETGPNWGTLEAYAI